MDDHVELDLPLSARHAATVRATAAAIAATIGLSVDDIDDLRLGVNEAVSVLTDVDDEFVGSGGRMHVRFETDATSVTVTASRRGLDASVPGIELDPLARRIMAAVVDEFHVDEGGAVSIRKRVAVDGVA